MADSAIVAHADIDGVPPRGGTAGVDALAIVPSRKPQRLPKLPGPLSDTIAKQPPIPLLGPDSLRAKPSGKHARTG